MFASTEQIKTLRYQMRKEERFDGTMQVQVSDIKLVRKPYQVYMKQISPKEGMEVLFRHGSYNGKALVNTNGFPWVTLKMDPEGTMMRKNQHHTVKDGGFDLVISILENIFTKYDNHLDDMLRFGTSVWHDNISCHHIVLENPFFTLIPYRVRENENILDIAELHHVSAHMILEKNSHLSDYNDVEPGDEIKIPNDYSPKMELLIDKKRLLPLSIKVFDDLGLYEHYQYSDVEIDPPLTNADFDRHNDAYGF